MKAWFTDERANQPIGVQLADRAAYEKSGLTTIDKQEIEDTKTRIQEAKDDKRSAKEIAQDNLDASNSYSGVSLNF